MPFETNTPESLFQNRINRHPHAARILTEGDSWFHLPLPAGQQRRNIIQQLHEYDETGAVYLRLEWSSDEAADMMRGSQLNRLRRVLNRFAFDAILFSGGGNDFLGKKGDYFKRLLRPPLSGQGPASCLDPAKMSARFDLVVDAYETLIAERDRLAPRCPILLHTYDYPIPQNRGVPFLPGIGPRLSGPWMWPHLQQLGITTAADQRKVTEALIDEFVSRIEPLAQGHTNRVYLVDLRGTVRDDQWGDEIHPLEEGFHALAGKYLPMLRTICPGHFTWPWV